MDAQSNGAWYTRYVCQAQVTDDPTSVLSTQGIRLIRGIEDPLSNCSFPENRYNFDRGDANPQLNLDSAGMSTRPQVSTMEEDMSQLRTTSAERDVSNLPRTIAKINELLAGLPKSRGKAPPAYSD